MSINYSLLPAHMRDGFRLYIEQRIPMGDFGMAVVENDLMGAFGKADDINRERMFDICAFLYNEAPPACYGSKEAVAAWIKGE
jgi:hypothetical protein